MYRKVHGEVTETMEEAREETWTFFDDTRKWDAMIIKLLKRGMNAKDVYQWNKFAEGIIFEYEEDDEDSD